MTDTLKGAHSQYNMMDQPNKYKADSLRNQCSQFAKLNPEINQKVFSHEILQSLANCGFLGWMIPKNDGRQANTAKNMFLASEMLMMQCENLGIMLSWMIHEIVSFWFINSFGDSVQKRKYLPSLINGRKTASIAISEPGVGPHPKYLKTSAKEMDPYFVMNGEKTYLTNAPLAEIFVVIAISRIVSDRKQYSAFIVTSDMAGFSRSETLNLPFVKSSPHGGILLNDCKIPKENLLGEMHTAYDSMVKPFREIEDTLMMGPILGGMKCQVINLASKIQTKNISLNEEQLLAVGKLQTTIESLRIIAEKSAELLDNKQPSSVLLLGFRQWVNVFQTTYASLSEQLFPGYLDDLTRDVCGIGKVASTVMQKKQVQIGKRLLESLVEF